MLQLRSDTLPSLDLIVNKAAAVLVIKVVAVISDHARPFQAGYGKQWTSLAYLAYRVVRFGRCRDLFRGRPEYRSQYLLHAKQALYHLS